MATDFGFKPVPSGKHYFISYNSEDKGRVGPVAQALNNSGVPLWYDYELVYGKEWEEQIADKISTAEAVIMFITKGIFEKERSYVRIEYELAEEYHIPIYVVFLDKIDTSGIPKKYAVWWQKIKQLQDIDGSELSAKHLAGIIKQAIEDPEAPKQNRIDIVNPAERPEGAIDNDVKNGTKTILDWKKSAMSAVLIMAVLMLIAVVYAIISHKGNPPSDGSNCYGTVTTTTTTPTTPSQSANPLLPSIDEVSVGKHLKFGSYPQTKSGEEKPIEWRVIDIDGNKVLLMSEYLLDCKKYNNTYEYLTWEQCTLRKWLNDDFLNTAFSAEEQSCLESRTNRNQDNSEHGTKGGNTTEDKVFILSRDEVDEYLGSHSAQQAKPTAYALKNGAHYDSESDAGQWWLRSPGAYGSYAAYIGTLGRVNYYGRAVNEGKKCVRPVILVTFPE